MMDTCTVCSIVVYHVHVLMWLQEFGRHAQTRGDAFTNFVLLSIWKLSFFVFITTIALNLIFGIILDTFSELRNKKVLFNERAHSLTTLKPSFHYCELTARVNGPS